jgi:UDP-glucose 4-epimerase
MPGKDGAGHSLNNLRGKTVLVTGASGFIGSHLTDRLLQEEGVRLVRLSRKPLNEVRRDVISVVAPFNQLSAATWRNVEVTQVDVLFHLGSFIPKSPAATDLAEEVYRDNLLGTRALLESFPLPPQRVIFSSTIDVYAPLQEGVVLDEDSPVGPVSLYGASKFFCEQLIRLYARKHGSGFAILRYGHIFGPGEEAYRKLIPETVRQLLQGQAPVLYGDGSTERDFLYVDDVVEATLRAAICTSPALGPVNVVRGDSRPIREVVETLMRIAGFPGRIQYLRDRPAGFSLRFDNRRMRESLGHWNLVSLEDGLQVEVDYFAKLANEQGAQKD